MYCVYCKEKIGINKPRIVDETENTYHIRCYLKMIGVCLDLIDEQLLKEETE